MRSGVDAGRVARIRSVIGGNEWGWNATPRQAEWTLPSSAITPRAEDEFFPYPQRISRPTSFKAYAKDYYKSPSSFDASISCFFKNKKNKKKKVFRSKMEIEDVDCEKCLLFAY